MRQDFIQVLKSKQIHIIGLQSRCILDPQQPTAFETILGMDAENVLQGRRKVKKNEGSKTPYCRVLRFVLHIFYLPSALQYIHGIHP